MIYRTIKYCIFVIFTLTLIYSCSTEKNTVISRTYHNITAKYNIYFNGEESYKNGIKKINKNIKDNYSAVLPVFTDGDLKGSKSVLSEMKKTVEKSSKVIRKHSITAKPKRKKNGRLSPKEKEFFEKPEYCKWIDDSYLIMGKAHFLRKDYYPAIETFEYIIKEYSNESIKYDGLLWLTRTYIEMGKYETAGELLQLISSEKRLPKKIKGMFKAIYADFYLRQVKYEDAIPYLKSAILNTKKKKTRSRYTFILAQVYQKTGQNKKAFLAYDEVIGMNPYYEMAFNAKINKATLFSSETGDSKEIKKELQKMLKDDKNIDYQDQIYYALANISYKEGYLTEAIDYYKLSSEKSTINTNQKALSFLALADIYFEEPVYTLAQIYYDSAITFLDEKHSDYQSIYKKSRNLNELVSYLTIVQTEDSLQIVASLSEKERLKLIDNIIGKVKEDEARQKEQNKLDRINNQLTQNYQSRTDPTGGGKWYFYNTNALSIGSSEFIKKWGRRKLEDDWRRKNKASISFDDITTDDASSSDSTSNEKVLSNKSREYYLQNLPMNDSLIEISDKRIIEALFNIGKIYKEKIVAYKKSIESLEKLNEQYPDNSYVLETNYMLYQVNKLSKNTERTEYYKNLIITNFPDSKYALGLSDPNFYKIIEQKEKQIKGLYERTYNYYNEEKYDFVIENFHYVDTAFKNNSLIPKFHFLKALSIGQTMDTLSFKNELNDIIAAYPNDEIKNSANEILAYLDRKKESDEPEEEKSAFEKDTVSAEEKIVEYTYSKKATHYYVIVVESKKTDANRIKFNVSNFNIDNFGMVDFKVSSVILNDALELITVKDFKSKNQGMNYYESIVEVSDIFKDTEETDYRHFIISVDNYAKFFRSKNVTQYIKFFNKKYIK
ncbi:MAG: hypothetical protein KAT68_17415 [Bacteroidales bacterium]|nr:hypothetical protein [Bacteroidales bacterium]